MRGRRAIRAVVLALAALAALSASGAAPGRGGSPILHASHVRAAADLHRTAARPHPAGSTGGSAAVAPLGSLQSWAAMFAALADPVARSWQGVDDSTAAPADTSGAIGPTRYVQLVNGRFAIYDRSSDTPLATDSLVKLLPGGVDTGTGGDLGNAQVIWDPATSRFYFAFLDLDPPAASAPFFRTAHGSNYIQFGFSKDASPSGPEDFCRYTLDYGYQHVNGLPADDALRPDFLKLGSQQHFVLLGVNVFDWRGSFYGADVDWAPKPPAGTTCPSQFDIDGAVDVRHGSAALTSPVPASQVDPSPTGWIVASNELTGSGSQTKLWTVKVTESNGRPVLGTASSITVPGYSLPDLAPQPGASPLDTLAGELGQAVSATDPSRSGSPQVLWTQHTVKGGAGAQVRWYELNPAAKTIVQSGSATSPTLYAFNGAIAPDRRHDGTVAKYGADMVLGFNTSSASVSPAIQWVAKQGSGAQSAFHPVVQSTVAAAGLGCDAGEPANPCSWGLYAGASPDPAADTAQLTGQVWLTSPWASGAGDDHTANWKTQNLAVRVPLTPPTVTSFSPTSGPVGTPVTISGTNLLGLSGVTIGGAAVTPAPVPTSATQIKTTVPAGALTGKVSVANDGGTATSSGTFKVTPKITPWPIPSVQVGLTPTTVSIDGTNLLNDNGTQGVLKLGSTTQTLTGTPTSEHLEFTLPDVVSNKLSITVNGSTYTTPTNLLIRPTIADVTPSATQGATVTLHGKTFTGTSSVKFTGFAPVSPASASSFKVVNASTLTAVVPSGAISGPVTVTNAGGPTASGPITVVPRTTAISPSSGPAGVLVTLTGTGFDNAATATVDGVELTDLQRVSATQLKGRIGAGAKTTGGTARVTTAGGTSPTGPAFKVTPNITPWPIAPVQAGDLVDLKGTNLLNDDGTTGALKLGSGVLQYAPDPAPAPTSTDLYFHVPDTAVSAKLAVTAAGSTFTTPTNLLIRPTLDALTGHAVAGASTTITGKTLSGTTAVKFSGYAGGAPSVAASFKLAGGALIVTVPAAAVTGPVSVTNAGGTTTSSDSFVLDPKVTSLSPASAGVGVAVTIAGSGLGPAAVATFTGGATALPEPGSTATSLKLKVPAGAGTGAITVAAPPSTVTPSTALFTLLAPPSIDSLSDDSGSAGAQITFTGTGLSGVSSVKFTGPGATQVTATFSTTGGILKATVPAGAVTGPVAVTTGGGTGTIDFIVLPKITSFSATSGPAGGSALITVNGSGFQPSSTLAFFDGVPASATAYVSSTKLTAKVPFGAATGALTVANPADATAMTSTQKFTVTFSVVAFGPHNGGPSDFVALTGLGFTSSSKVYFGYDGTGACATVVSACGTEGTIQPGRTSTGMTVSAPATFTTGYIVVRNGSSFTRSATKFALFFVGSPSPDSGPTGQLVHVPGAGFPADAIVTFDGDPVPAVIAPDGTDAAFTVPDGAVPESGFATPHAAVVTVGGVEAASLFSVTLGISAVDPNQGGVGAAVTVRGLGFTDLDPTSLTFGAPAATAPFHVLPDGDAIETTVPANAVQGKLTLTNSADSPQSVRSAEDAFTLMTITPSHGPVGTEVVITGTGFVGPAEVKFEDTADPTAIVADETTITARVPAGAATGSITVTNGGAELDAGTFTVDPLPAPSAALTGW